MMDMKQILLFGLVLLVPVWSSRPPRCYGEQEVNAHQRKFSSHFPQPPEPSTTAEPDSNVICPVEQFSKRPLQDISSRSLSPWRYVLRTLKDHFPSTYAEAQCLCSGCILIQDNPGQGKEIVESDDYYSHPIKQSRVFLKKEPCTKNNTYSLTPVNHDVIVGCTCVRVRTSS